MGKFDGHVSLVLGANTKGSAGCLGGGVVRDYGLTDEQITRDFELLPPSDPAVLAQILQAMPAMEAYAKRENQQFAFVRWPNGVASLLCFDRDRLCPRPEQLIRAYKNAFSARQVFGDDRGSRQEKS